AHALASSHDVTEHLLVEAHRSATSPLAQPAYLPGVAARAWRWAPEMHEIADTLTEAGLPPHLAQATAEVLGRWKDDKVNREIPLTDVLRHLAQDPAADLVVVLRCVEEQVEEEGYHQLALARTRDEEAELGALRERRRSQRRGRLSAGA